MCESDSHIDIARHKGKQTDSDTQTGRQADRQTDRQKDGQMDTRSHAYIYTYTRTNTHTYTHTHTHTPCTHHAHTHKHTHTRMQQYVSALLQENHLAQTPSSVQPHPPTLSHKPIAADTRTQF